MCSCLLIAIQTLCMYWMVRCAPVCWLQYKHSVCTEWFDVLVFVDCNTNTLYVLNGSMCSCLLIVIQTLCVYWMVRCDRVCWLQYKHSVCTEWFDVLVFVDCNTNTLYVLNGSVCSCLLIAIQTLCMYWMVRCARVCWLQYKHSVCTEWFEVCCWVKFVTWHQSWQNPLNQGVMSGAVRV